MISEEFGSKSVRSLDSSSPTGRRTFLFLSSCPEAWGGSEELWHSAALRYASAGHRVHVIKTLVDPKHPRVVELTAKGVTIDDLWDLPVPGYAKLPRRVLPQRLRNRLANFCDAHIEETIARMNPDLVIVNQGANFDALNMIGNCINQRVPYVILCQKASDSHWPADETRSFMRRCYFDAKASFFVCRHNQLLTEHQIGARLLNAEVVRTPFMEPIPDPLPWPEFDDDTFRLASVARLYIAEKGQDILLETLAMPKWRERKIALSLYGKGIHAEGIRQMANMLGLPNVQMRGFCNSIPEIWQNHHALVMPSRAEGLPITLIQALWCGRPAIVTRVAGTAEVIDDNETGFLSLGANPEAFDEALERAWQRRHEWEAIGKRAAERIRELVPRNPGDIFATKLMGLVEDRSLAA